MLNDCGPNAICTFGIVISYSVKHTKKHFIGDFSNPLKSSHTIALVISLALSGLKLKNITESSSLILATG